MAANTDVRMGEADEDFDEDRLDCRARVGVPPPPRPVAAAAGFAAGVRAGEGDALLNGDAPGCCLRRDGVLPAPPAPARGVDVRAGEHPGAPPRRAGEGDAAPGFNGDPPFLKEEGDGDDAAPAVTVRAREGVRNPTPLPPLDAGVDGRLLGDGDDAATPFTDDTLDRRVRDGVLNPPPPPPVLTDLSLSTPSTPTPPPARPTSLPLPRLRGFPSEEAPSKMLLRRRARGTSPETGPWIGSSAALGSADVATPGRRRRRAAPSRLARA